VEGALCVAGLSACFAYLRGEADPSVKWRSLSTTQLQEELHKAHMKLSQVEMPHIDPKVGWHMAYTKTFETARLGKAQLLKELEIVTAKLKGFNIHMPTVGMPEMRGIHGPNLTAPTLPSMHAPNIHMPDVHAPNLHMPDIKGHMPGISMPNIHGPHLTAPTLPTMHAPNIHMPDVHAPNVHMLDIKGYTPNIHGPNLTAPTLPTMHAPNIHMPDVHAPNVHMPDIKGHMPSMPNIQWRSLHPHGLEFPHLNAPHFKEAAAAYALKVKGWGRMEEDKLREELHKAHVYLHGLRAPSMDPQAAAADAKAKVEEAGQSGKDGLIEALHHTHAMARHLQQPHLEAQLRETTLTAKVGNWMRTDEEKLREELHKAHTNLGKLKEPGTMDKLVIARRLGKDNLVEGLRDTYSKTYEVKPLDIYAEEPWQDLDEEEDKAHEDLARKLLDLESRVNKYARGHKLNPRQLRKELDAKTAQVAELEEQYKVVGPMLEAEAALKDYNEQQSLHAVRLEELQGETDMQMKMFEEAQKRLEEIEREADKAEARVEAAERAEQGVAPGEDYVIPLQLDKANASAQQLRAKVAELELKIKMEEDKAHTSASRSFHDPLHPAVEALRRRTLKKADLHKELEHAHRLLDHYLGKVTDSAEKAKAMATSNAYKALDIMTLEKNKLREELEKAHGHLAALAPDHKAMTPSSSTQTFVYREAPLVVPTTSHYIVRFK